MSLTKDTIAILEALKILCECGECVETNTHPHSGYGSMAQNCCKHAQKIQDIIDSGG